jgi:hypothetical protein
MSNYEYDADYITPQEIRAMEKRASCSCTYMKCPKCGRSQDNLFNEQNEKIKLLTKMIQFYENAFAEYGINTIPITFLLEFGVIDSLVQKRKHTYETNKKRGKIIIGRF